MEDNNNNKGFIKYYITYIIISLASSLSKV